MMKYYKSLKGGQKYAFLFAVGLGGYLTYGYLKRSGKLPAFLGGAPSAASAANDKTNA